MTSVLATFMCLGIAGVYAHWSSLISRLPSLSVLLHVSVMASIALDLCAIILLCFGRVGGALWCAAGGFVLLVAFVVLALILRRRGDDGGPDGGGPDDDDGDDDPDGPGGPPWWEDFEQAFREHVRREERPRQPV